MNIAIISPGTVNNYYFPILRSVFIALLTRKRQGSKHVYKGENVCTIFQTLIVVQLRLNVRKMKVLIVFAFVVAAAVGKAVDPEVALRKNLSLVHQPVQVDKNHFSIYIKLVE